MADDKNYKKYLDEQDIPTSKASISRADGHPENFSRESVGVPFGRDETSPRSPGRDNSDLNKRSSKSNSIAVNI